MNFKNNNIYPLIISLFAIVIYLNSFWNDFTNWDDDELIINNYRIQDLNLTKFKKILTTPTITDYLPIKELSYALDYYFWKLNPFGYHLSNLILFVLNCILVYLILDNIFKNKFISFLGSAIFTVHPIHVESVTWLSARKDLLSGLFFFLSFYTYIKHRYFLSVISFFLALLSKPTVIILPLILFFYELILNKRERDWKAMILRIFPFFFLSTAFGFITLKVGFEKGIVKEYLGETFLLNLMVMSRVFFDYIKMLFFPINLCVRYMIPIEISLKSILFLLFLLSFIILFVTKIRINSEILFFLLWFVITMLPTSNIIPISTLKADRYLYLSSLSFASITVILLNKIYSKAPKSGILLIISLLILSFSILTVERNKVWKNSITLMQDTIKKSPNLFIGYNNLGIAYWDMGLYDKAIASYEKALGINPLFAKTHANLGTLYAKLKNYEKAFAELKSALKLDPNLSGAHYNLGLTFEEIGLLDEAILEYEKAIRLTSEHEQFLKILKEAKQKRERIRKEMTNPERAKEIKMKLSDSYNDLGAMELMAKMYGEAEISFKNSLKHNFMNKMARMNLGNIYYLRGEFDKSIAEYEEVIKSNSKFYKAYWNLGLAYKAKGDRLQALEAFNKILKVAPENATVKMEIKKLKE